jgi:phosphoesterase RecJ-like protein
MKIATGGAPVNLEFAVNFFKTHDNFTILTHSNPDGDTLGSGYALCGALHIIGKHARVLCDDAASPRFDFLKNAINPSLTKLLDSPETVVTVDVADMELLGSLKTKYPKIDMCIDHHISNKNFAINSLLDTQAAACAELVWELIMEIEASLNDPFVPPLATAEIAAAIYTGISTDTGCFRYPNTTPISHMFAAEVIGYGFDVEKINYIMFEMKTRERVLLEQQALLGIEYFFSGRCAVIVLTAEMLTGIDPEDASNVSVLPKQIEGVVAGVVIKEKDTGAFKVSVRTSPEVDAQSICAALGGGGHRGAAGCTLNGDLESVKSAILREIEKQMV